VSTLYPQPGEVFDGSFFDHGASSYHLTAAQRLELGIAGAARTGASGGPSGSTRAHTGAPPEAPFLPLGITSTERPGRDSEPGVFRVPRPYVQGCCKGTLALAYEGGRFRFRALACGSWNCPHCRRSLAARTLDRLRRGLEARAGKLTFVTLTLDPSRYGAVVVGWSYWNRDGSPFEGDVSPATLQDLVRRGEVRRARRWSAPTVGQFQRASEDMSRQFKKLCDRLNRKASYAGLGRWGYFRVIELHRSGWPHYHVVFEHSDFCAGEISRQLDGWSLGIWDAREISVDDAVAELAPYLTSTEYKGSKAYQFAASSLPKHFRLHSSSKGFLADRRVDEGPEVVHAQVLRGHFASFMAMLPEFPGAVSECLDLVHVPAPGPVVLPGGAAQLALKPPGPEHRPPASWVASGGEVAALYGELIVQEDRRARLAGDRGVDTS
jgi:hypothetical protein